MTWHPRNQSGAHLRWRGKYMHSCCWRDSWWLVWWRGGWLCRIAGVADDWLLAWRVNPVQLQTIGWGRRVESVAQVVARGQCCRRRVLERAVMQDVGSSPGFHQWILLFFLDAMVMSKTRFENFDFWVWIKHPLFQEQALIPIVGEFRLPHARIGGVLILAQGRVNTLTQYFTWFGKTAYIHGRESILFRD
jgi:hypothetical protein